MPGITPYRKRFAFFPSSVPSLKPNTLSGCAISRCLPSLFSKFSSAFFFHIRFEENGTKISVSTIQCQAAEELRHGQEIFV